MAEKLRLKEWATALGPFPRGYQTQLARQTGVDQSYIANLFAGRKKNPSADVLRVISKFLGVTMDDLYELPPSKSEIIAIGGLSEAARRALTQRNRPS